jgi:RimJ/RimL family protein N-acetyltransferase
VLAQFLVITRTEGRPVAIASAYNLDPLNRFAYISLARLPHAEPRRCVLEGMLLFVDYVFACWPLRKLYAEAIEFNLEQFASGSGRSFRTEARLVERTFYAGRFWDVLIIAVDRASWSKYAAPLLPAIVAEP